MEELETGDCSPSRNHWCSKKRIQAKSTASLLINRETLVIPGVFLAALDKSHLRRLSVYKTLSCVIKQG